MKRQFKTKPTGRPRQFTDEERSQRRKEYGRRYRESGRNKENSKRFYQRHSNEENYKQKRKEYNNNWMSKQTPEDRERVDQLLRKGRKRRDIEEPRRSMINNSRKRAKEKGLEFSITIDDIIIPSHCPVLGIPLIKVGGKRTANSPSIDRVDNNKGYIKGNVQVISNRANSLKNDGTVLEFEQILKYMKENGLVR